jgi:hypothetical protein
MTVRQLFLVVILIAASFVGGAFVNGPGLQWAQSRLLRSVGLIQGGEIASVELKPVANSDPDSQASSSESMPTKPTIDTPQNAVVSPALQTETNSSKQDASDQSTTSTSVVQPKLIAKRLPSTSFQPSSSLPTKRSLADSRPQDHEPGQLDTTVTPVGGVSVQDSASESSPSKSDSAPNVLESLAALLPVDSPSSARPSSTSPSPAPTPKVLVNGTDTWAILERKMQSFGVVRYTIDGEPGGRVVFSCLIPLAGRQAVAYRFEAEGEDVIHAAQAALRRIALWRATRPSLP